MPSDSIIFISQPEPHVNAVYGGLMSLRAQILGAKGVIIDGRVRDVQEHRDLGFPVCEIDSISDLRALTRIGFR